MKLLIVTQSVDQEDSDLGFFVRWIEEFAKHAEHLEVICLKEGKHKLPANVRVHSLGKERASMIYHTSTWRRVAYAARFYVLMWRLRHEYDTVFVHMNPEYVILGGVFWRMWGKKIALWYTHKSVDLKLRVAEKLAGIIFTASKESFRLASKKVHVMKHGIDVDFFSPDARIARGDWALSVGRLMPSKRHDLAIRRAVQEGRALRIAGEGPERARLEALAHELHASVQFLGALTQAQLRDEYRTAAYFIHTSETGSLDKVVLEALACGLPIVTNDPALKPLEHEGPQYVREQHSLQKLIPAILNDMQAL
ncbi:MAG: glycosyltransferase [Candidatus Paceibacterota bacterium]|jgi:glycosyltransferase involved in cell wall biosynthesis